MAPPAHLSKTPQGWSGLLPNGNCKLLPCRQNFKGADRNECGMKRKAAAANLETLGRQINETRVSSLRRWAHPDLRRRRLTQINLPRPAIHRDGHGLVV